MPPHPLCVLRGESSFRQSLAPEVTPTIHHTRLSSLVKRISSEPAPSPKPPVPPSSSFAPEVSVSDDHEARDGLTHGRVVSILRSRSHPGDSPYASLVARELYLVRTSPKPPAPISSFAPEVSVSDTLWACDGGAQQTVVSQFFAPEVQQASQHTRISSFVNRRSSASPAPSHQHPISSFAPEVRPAIQHTRISSLVKRISSGPPPSSTTNPQFILRS